MEKHRVLMSAVTSDDLDSTKGTTAGIYKDKLVVKLSAPLITGKAAKGTARSLFQLDGTECSGNSCTISSRDRTYCKEYISEFSLADDHQFILHNDAIKAPALHYVTDRCMAELIISAVPEQEIPNLLLAVDMLSWTALHLTSYVGRLDVVQYLCSFSLVVDELVFKRDSYGQTALHVAKDRYTAEAIINAVEHCNINVVTLADKEGQTALHTAAEDSIADVVEYLCQIYPADDLQLLKNNKGQTALHVAECYEVVEALLESVDDLVDYVKERDNQGYTALMYYVLKFTPEELTSTLKYIEDNCEPLVDLKYLLEQRNADGHNVFHLAALSRYTNNVFPILCDYLDYVDLVRVLVADSAGNTPLDYLMFSAATELFAQVVTGLPFVQRRNLFSRKSITNSNDACKPESRISRESQKPVNLKWRLASHEIKFQIIAIYDDIFKIIKYGLNEYSLLDSAYVYTWKLFASAAAKQAKTLLTTFSTASPLAVGTAQENQLNCTAVESPSSRDEEGISILWLHIDHEGCEQEEEWRNVQNKLLEMDRPEYHGLPKVILVSTLDADANLIPPGPDSIIVTCVYSEKMKESLSTYTDLYRLPVDPLVRHILSDHDVKHVNINSTLCSRYTTAGMNSQLERRLVTGCQRGKALIVCNRTDRDACWENEFKDANHVLANQLGLTVEVVYDQTAAGIISCIKEFSGSEGHGDLVALAIMSHGGDGDITGDDGRERCSVQSIIDALCTEKLSNVPKMVQLSFCRGSVPLTNTNRVSESWESSVLRSLTGGYPAAASQPLDERVRAAEWRSNPFPHVELPPDCYVCFSTLPDSKSERAVMFSAIREYLTEVCMYGIDEVVMATPKHPGQEQSPANTSKPLAQIEVINMLADVAAVVRNSSRYRQHINVCYKVDRHSRPLYIQVLPSLG